MPLPFLASQKISAERAGAEALNPHRQALSGVLLFRPFVLPPIQPEAEEAYRRYAGRHDDPAARGAGNRVPYAFQNRKRAACHFYMGGRRDASRSSNGNGSIRNTRKDAASQYQNKRKD